MKSQSCKSSLVRSNGEELSLRGSVLRELLIAVLETRSAFRFKATGFSMSPLIKDGDVIKVLPIRRGPLSLGDVVAFTCPLKGQLLIHRIITEKKGGFITRGDSASEPDGIIPKTNIIGRVGEVERHGKKVRFGLGRERLLLAFLSRTGLYSTVATTVWPAIRPIVRRWVT